MNDDSSHGPQTSGCSGDGGLAARAMLIQVLRWKRDNEFMIRCGIRSLRQMYNKD